MESYRHYLYENSEYGISIEVRHPIVIVNGLPNAQIDEIVIFEDGQIGQVFSMGRDTVEILMYTQDRVRNGASVTRTGKSVSIPVGMHLLGKVLSPLGDLLNGVDTNEVVNSEVELRPIDVEALDIPYRTKITKPFYTGTTVVDQMIPIGKGQRELIIGDRKTGKSSFLLTAIKNNSKDTIIIYAAIGRKQSEIKKLEDFFIQEGIMDKTVIVSTSSSDSPGYIYLTPYSAMTIAEYFRDKGMDVLIIFDDLTYHAKIYREVSLQANRFPGRDAYPGDVFYLHSKLLERSGSFLHKEKGEVCITCFPVAESVEGDLRGYISTNLMGMTDGHIFFDRNIYSQGIRPSINIPLSVTRVGRQTRNKLEKEINTVLLSFFAKYNKVVNFSHFGSELSAEIENIIQKGDQFLALFNQNYKVTVPTNIQLLLVGMIWVEFFKNMTIDDVKKIKNKFVSLYKTHPEYFDRMLNVSTLKDLSYMIENNLSQLQELCRVNPE